jgi:hypothetical protein
MRRYSPGDAHHGDFHHAKQLLGMVFFMDAASVGANKTANSFAGIRPWMPRRYSPARVCICGIKRTTIVTTINAN